MILVDTYRKFKKIGWFLPGFILYAAFPPMCEVSDVLFALSPLMWLSRRGDPRTSAKRWFMSGIFFWVATLAWMPAIVKNGGPWPLVLLGWGALAAYCAAYFAAYGYLSAAYWRWAREKVQDQRSKVKGQRSKVQGAESELETQNLELETSNSKLETAFLRFLGILIVEPVLWAGLELVRSRFLGGFAWNQLGVVPVNAGFGAPAAIGGVYLLSAVVILINGTFAGIAERMIAGIRARMRKTYDADALSRWRSLETVLALALVWGVYALAHFTEMHPREKDVRPLKVAMIQRNFPCVFQAKEDDPYEVYSNLLANVSLLKPDLVVLPESALCEFGPVNQQGAVRFARWVARQTDGAALLAGGTRFGDGKIFNSAALYQSSPQAARRSAPTDDEHSTFNFQLSTYDKVHLVPFGEFIPGDKWFPVLQKLAPVGSCTPGKEELLVLNVDPCSTSAHFTEMHPRSPSPSSSTFASLPFGVAICFEDTDSALMRRYAAKGALFLCFITNDSWFSHSNETLAHAWQATARAIETGLPVVRVGNSGVTGTIAPDGKASWLCGPNGKPLVDRSGTMMDLIKAKGTGEGERRTVYVRCGDLPIFFAFLLLMAAMILVKYANHYGKHRSLSL